MWGPFHVLLFAALLLGSLSHAQDDVDSEIIIWTVPNDTIHGAFIFPRTYPLFFQEGTTVNISWTTSLDFVGLYWNHQGAIGTHLLTGKYTTGCLPVMMLTFANERSTPWYQWKVDAIGGNLSNPFSFGIFGAPDTDEGYFFSTSFYITRKDAETSSSRSISTPTLSSSSSSIRSILPTLATTRTLPNPSDEATRFSLESESHGVDRKLTLGLGIGLGGAFLIIVAGLVFVFWKRHQRKAANKAAATCSPTVVEEAPETREYKPVPHKVYAGTSDMGGSGSHVDMPVLRNMAHAVEYQDEWIQSARK